MPKLPKLVPGSLEPYLLVPIKLCFDCDLLQLNDLSFDFVDVGVKRRLENNVRFFKKMSRIFHALHNT